MIFKQWQQVLKQEKIQTRRLVRRGEQLTPNKLHTKRSWPFPPTVLANRRIKWQIGRTYAVQPKRGQKAVGRIRITGIRRERLRDISEEDALAEGMFKERHPIALKPVTRYMQLWNSIHKKPGIRWEDAPEVWVLEFECVEVVG